MFVRSLVVLLLLVAAALPLKPDAAAPVAAQSANDADAGAGYIVVLDNSVVSAADVSSSIEAQYGLEIEPEQVYRNALNGFAASLTDEAVAALREDPRVLAVEPDRTVYAAAQTLPTGVDRIDADENSVARIGQGASIDVDVAVLDAGVGPHGDLTIAGGVDCTGSGGYADDSPSGHGTHVAGIVAAKDNDTGVVGVAPGARIWAVKVLEANGTGTVSQLLCGIDWVTANASTIEIANLSLGLYLSVGANCASSALRTAVCSAVNAGVTFVAAAGNDRVEMSSYVPAAYPEVIAVAALADSDGRSGGAGANITSGCDDCFANFSNYGAAIDLVAPGGAIRSTLPGNSYGSKSGTSMASPHVAGAAALYLVENPSASPATVKNALQSQSVLTSIPNNPAGVAQYVLDVGDGWDGSGPPAGVTLDKEKSKYNGWVTAAITGFSPNTVVSVKWQDGTILTQATTNASGNVTTMFRTPLVAYGTYTVTVSSGGRSAQTTLSVIPRILLNETSGPVDTVLRVYFYGFSPGERVEVRWSDEAESSYVALATITIASNGRGTSLIDIPPRSNPDTYLIRGKVIGVSRSASTTFEVTAGANDVPEPTATIGQAGMTLDKEKSKYNGWVEATLGGFAANQSISLTWPDGTVLDTAQTDGAGVATARFRTPLAAYGTYDVTATGGGRQATTALAVIPRILLNETTGGRDTVLRVYFYGFAPGEQVEVRWADENETNDDVLATVTIASNGRGTSLIDIPANADAGTYLIRGKVIGVSRSASTTFVLTGVASVEEAGAATSTPTPDEPRSFPTPTPSVPQAPTATPTFEPTSTPEPTLEPSPTVEPTMTPTPEPPPVEETPEP